MVAAYAQKRSWAKGSGCAHMCDLGAEEGQGLLLASVFHSRTGENPVPHTPVPEHSERAGPRGQLFDFPLARKPG